MIEIFEGRLGGGKTYSAVYRIICHLALGGVVCTNIELIWDGLLAFGRDVLGVIFESDQVIVLNDEHICEFYKYTPSGDSDLAVLVVLDELHLWFNARDYAQSDKLYRGTMTFLSQSRKVDTNLIFISQSALNMDKQFFRLVQYIWRFRDLANWKIPGLGMGSPWKGIVACQYDYDGKTMLDRAWVPKDKRIFACYRTKALLKKFPRLEGIVTKRKLQRVPGHGRLLRVSTIILAILDIVIWLLVLLRK